MATIKDVARMAGVGLGTASRVVSGRGAVSPATRERVQKAIAQLDFRPSHAARALLSGTSRMIGVYAPCLTGSALYAPVIEALEAELRTNNLHLVVAFGMGAGDARRQAVDGVDFLLGRGCDGVLVIGNALTDPDLYALGARSERLVFV
ncbi:MAG TPA: LacI family DNA-binding transcriptional regulator, partial [Telluria sp.]|nr:LacI family DNA-binding transcriptional regulator [Telluria sp.]